MYTYSKKSRRRMHAIPAAIALLSMAMFWYFTDHSRVLADTSASPHKATVLLSTDTAQEWELDCDDCLLEPQYDVMYGDVLRLQSRNEMVMSLELEKSVSYPQLSWRWTVDAFVERQPLMRLTIHVKETDHWPERVLHYVWDSGRAAGEQQALSDFEHLVVVNGKDSDAENWQQVDVLLNNDWQRIYEEDFPQIEYLEIALGMPGKSGATGGFLQQLTLASVAPVIADSHPLDEAELPVSVDDIQQLPATAMGAE